MCVCDNGQRGGYGVYPNHIEGEYSLVILEGWRAEGGIWSPYNVASCKREEGHAGTCFIFLCTFLNSEAVSIIHCV